MSASLNIIQTLDFKDQRLHYKNGNILWKKLYEIISY